MSINHSPKFGICLHSTSAGRQEVLFYSIYSYIQKFFAPMNQNVLCHVAWHFGFQFLILAVEHYSFRVKENGADKIFFVSVLLIVFIFLNNILNIVVPMSSSFWKVAKFTRYKGMEFRKFQPIPLILVLGGVKNCFAQS